LSGRWTSVPPPEDKVSELPIIGDDSAIFSYSRDAVELVNGLGSVGDTSLRTKIYYKFKNLGYRFRKVIHPAATVAKDCSLGEGVQILAVMFISHQAAHCLVGFT